MTTNLPALISLSDMERMAKAMSQSQLFGVSTPEAALSLMLVAQAEGLHPATAMMEFHVINKKPSRKAWAMQARFQAAGGSIKWLERTDETVSATFSHPQGGTVTIDWDMARAKAANLLNNPTWKAYPRQMLTARVISEGVRTVFPGATGGFYAPEEVADFGPDKARDITPPKPKAKTAEHTRPSFNGVYDPETGTIVEGKATTEPGASPRQLVPMHWPTKSDDRAAWLAAAKRALAEARALTTVADLEAWQEANAEGIKTMREANNDVYQNMGEKLQFHHAKLSGQQDMLDGQNT